MSERFAECQDFLQLQEQEFFNLKLQHGLDSKVVLCSQSECFYKVDGDFFNIVNPVCKQLQHLTSIYTFLFVFILVSQLCNMCP